MKKTSLFFILIFSVFFSYHTAYGATAYHAYAGQVDSTHLDFSTGGALMTGITEANTCPITNGLYGIQLYRGTFPDDSTEIGGATYAGPHWSDYSNFNIAGMGTIIDGAYWVAMRKIDRSGGCSPSFPTGDLVYYVMTVSGSGTIYTAESATPPDLTARITDILPADGSTTGSTTVSVSANYYFGTSDTSVYPSPPITLIARVHRTDGIGSPDQNFDFSSLTYDSLTAVSTTFTLPTGTIWELRWDISGSGYYFLSPFGTPTNFIVVSDPTTGTSGYTTCSITDIAGCMQNALVFLFYPSSASLSQYNGLYLQFINKPPFGYIVGVQNILKNVSISGTSVFTLQSMPILDTYIFDPFRTAIAWILWVAFAFVLFHRLKNISI